LRGIKLAASVWQEHPVVVLAGASVVLSGCIPTECIHAVVAHQYLQVVSRTVM
jgi:hypothetical protein